MYKEGINWLISEMTFCLERKAGEWFSPFGFCFVDFGVGVVCFCVYFPEHLRVILHSYSSRREMLRADTPADPSSHACPCYTVPGLSPTSTTAHLASHSFTAVWRGEWNTKQRHLCDLSCPTSIAVCKQLQWLVLVLWSACSPFCI